jgi:protein-L-isoaspartate(D-aspartate) O-methyltransferase
MFERRLIAFALLILAFPIYHGGFSTTLLQPEMSKPEKQPSPDEERELARLRQRMVRLQLQGRDITDARVLEAMLNVPRHLFISPDLRAHAYSDGALPIRHGQTISQPYIVAFMTQLLELKGSERVLEIGTGSGYQAAVLAEIVRQVYTIEIVPELGREAESVLKKLGYRNIEFRIGDGYDGWPEQAPFDRIIVTAAPEEIPRPLIQQLQKGGRLVCPVGETNQDLVVLIKEESGITRRSTIPVRFVPMTGKAQE